MGKIDDSSGERVNAEQLLFNWQLGRDLVIRKAEEKWGSGVVEQVSMDLDSIDASVIDRVNELIIKDL